MPVHQMPVAHARIEQRLPPGPTSDPTATDGCTGTAPTHPPDRHRERRRSEPARPRPPTGAAPHRERLAQRTVLNAGADAEGAALVRRRRNRWRRGRQRRRPVRPPLRRRPDRSHHGRRPVHITRCPGTRTPRSRPPVLLFPQLVRNPQVRIGVRVGRPVRPPRPIRPDRPVVTSTTTKSLGLRSFPGPPRNPRNPRPPSLPVPPGHPGSQGSPGDPPPRGPARPSQQRPRAPGPRPPQRTQHERHPQAPAQLDPRPERVEPEHGQGGVHRHLRQPGEQRQRQRRHDPQPKCAAPGEPQSAVPPSIRPPRSSSRRRTDRPYEWRTRSRQDARVEHHQSGRERQQPYAPVEFGEPSEGDGSGRVGGEELVEGVGQQLGELARGLAVPGDEEPEGDAEPYAVGRAEQCGPRDPLRVVVADRRVRGRREPGEDGDQQDGDERGGGLAVPRGARRPSRAAKGCAGRPAARSAAPRRPTRLRRAGSARCRRRTPRPPWPSRGRRSCRAAVRRGPRDRRGVCR